MEQCFDLLSTDEVMLLYNTVNTVSEKAGRLDGHLSLDGTDKSLIHSIRALAGVLQVRSCMYIECCICNVFSYEYQYSMLAVTCPNYCIADGPG